MKLKSGHKEGFTLVEMLVVIGIIGVITAALMNSFGYLKRIAKRNRAQNAVTAAYTALNLYLLKERQWHASMIDALEMDELVCQTLAENQLLDVKVDRDISGSTSSERFGFLDDWGNEALKRNPSVATATQNGFDGIPIADRRIQFRLDTNYDGYVDASEDSPKGYRIRASVIVWSRGPDGQDDFNSKNPKAQNRYPYDDLISWNQSQVTGQ